MPENDSVLHRIQGSHYKQTISTH
ncbi:ribokinase, partial [Salmonella enterica]|nr:ribokinase [Salmonella enterica]